MALIDTNIVLRYLIGDDVVQSPQAKEIINQNNVVVRIEVLFEVVHVLNKVYQLERSAVCDILKQFLQKNTVTIKQFDCVMAALNCYAENNIDFVDALLWAYHVTEGEAVFTFDKKLNRLLQRKNFG